MPNIRNKLSLNVNAGACLSCVIMLFVLPLQWIFAAVISALVHEGCHALAVRLCGGRVSAVQVGQHGTRMQTSAFVPIKEIICCLAGPAGSLLLLLFLRYIPRIAFCALVQGIYNLLPLSHLDGGKALSITLRMLFPGNAEKISIAIQTLSLIALWSLAVYIAFFRHLGLLPLLFVLAISASEKKDLANVAANGYNSMDTDKGV